MKMVPDAEQRARDVLCARCPGFSEFGECGDGHCSDLEDATEAIRAAYEAGERAGAERERDACAKVCDERVELFRGLYEEAAMEAQLCAAHIRRRSEGEKKPICATCNDTHRMPLGEDRVAMCTDCPTPCVQCGDGGPFCLKTPCDCGCHKARSEGEKGEGK